MAFARFKKSKTKAWVVQKSIDMVREGDHLWVYGGFHVVTRVRKTKEHPIQMYRIWIEGLSDANCICAPAGWVVEVEDTIGTEGGIV